METLAQDALQQAFDDQPLFKDKVWRLSPEPWNLTPAQAEALCDIGQACLEFYRAQERLYRFACEGRNLLRNSKLDASWVLEYLDRGKPKALIEHSRQSLLKNSHPMIIRPDVLQTEDGFVLTEMDAVPGGIGLTAYLNQVYGDVFPDTIGAGNLMPEAFYRSVA